jgi:hypothetical protein
MHMYLNIYIHIILQVSLTTKSGSRFITPQTEETLTFELEIDTSPKAVSIYIYMFIHMDGCV